MCNKEKRGTAVVCKEKPELEAVYWMQPLGLVVFAACQ